MERERERESERSRGRDVEEKRNQKVTRGKMSEKRRWNLFVLDYRLMNCLCFGL